MTKYAELYRKEQEDKDRLRSMLQRQIDAMIADVQLLRDFIRENDLQDQLCQWAYERINRDKH